MRVKVLHLTSGNLYGGIETYLLTLARLRHLCPAMEPEFGVCFAGRLRDELTAVGVPVHDLGAVRTSRPWTVLAARRRLRQLLTGPSDTCVVTHGTWTHAVFAPVVKRAGVRLVNAVHGELTGRHWIDRWAARTQPNAAVANSRFTAGTVRSVFPGVPVEVCYLPVPPSRPADPATRDRVRAEFQTPPGAVVILMVSRIEVLKGHAVLLEALSRIADLAGWVCWVIGGAQRPSETALLADLRAGADRAGIADRVAFLGPRADVPAMMAAADLYCQPNTGPEGFGLAFVEALYAGLPVVTSDFGGAAEIVTAACGVLCQPGDVGAVADALRGLIADPSRRQALGTAGPARAAELCDPGRQLCALAEAMSEALPALTS